MHFVHSRIYSATFFAKATKCEAKKNLKLSAVRLRRAEFLAGVLATAPTGGESPSYFKDRPQNRKVHDKL